MGVSRTREIRALADRRAPSAIWAVALVAILLGVTEQAQAAFPGANGKIAFSSNRDGDYDIYTMNPDGSRVTQLTNDPAPDDSPAWSRGGDRIAFERDSCSSCFGGDIWIMNADGSGQTKLLGFLGAVGFVDPAWSPDAQKIAFARDDHCGGNLTGLNVMNADGTSPSNLACPDRGVHGPNWSPDGGTIVFGAGLGGITGIWSVRADGTSLTRLTSNVGGGDTHPNWSPNQQQVVFGRSTQPPGDGIYAMNPDGSSQTKIPGTSAFDSDPAWAPDATRIAFSKSVCATTCESEIYTMNPDGTGQLDVANDPASDVDPDWGVLPPTADLVVTNTDSPDPVLVGGLLTYTVQVQNAGPLGASGVMLTDAFTKRVRIRSVDASQGNCTLRRETVTCRLDDVAAGASATVTITLRPSRAKPITSTASAFAADPPDPNTANNTATATTTVLK